MRYFCITLKGNTARQEACRKRFEEAGIDVEFFEGVDGKKLGLEPTIPYMVDQPNWKPGDGPMYFITQGHVGCILSHMFLWNTLKHIAGEDEFTIFEDDVTLCEGFKAEFDRLRADAPKDWSILFLGHCCLPNQHLVITPGLVETNYPPLCTHAYCVKKSALDHLFKTNMVVWGPIDIQMRARSLPNMRFYSMLPPIADQLSTKGEGTPEGFKSLTV